MKIIRAVIGLVLIISLFAGCKPHVANPPVVTPELTIEEEIIYDYYYNVTSIEFQMQHFPDEISLRFRGAFSDTYVVFVDGPFEYIDGVLNEYVNGYLFQYSDGNAMLAYHQGSFYSLAEAFDLGFLTAADVTQLKINYMNFSSDPSQKGDVPTERKPCTHTGEVPTESSEPTQATEPTVTTQPTESTAPTEPVDWNVLLPDIPAVTEPTAKPEVMNTETLVHTLYDYTLVWDNSKGENQHITIQLPAIVPFCDGAIEINEAIRNAFKYAVERTRRYYENQWSTGTSGIYYAVSLHDNLLSIRTFETTPDLITHERYWTLDITTGKQLETLDLAKRYLQESYPVFLQHCTDNLIAYFTANPLEDANQQNRLIKCLSNEVYAIGHYTLYLDFDGTLALDFRIAEIHIEGIPYNVINDDSWTGNAASAYHWLFTVKADGEGADQLAGLLLDSFFENPDQFVKMLSLEDSATIEDVASLINYGLYLPEDIARFKELCDDIYLTATDPKVAETASILSRSIHPL